VTLWRRKIFRLIVRRPSAFAHAALTTLPFFKQDVQTFIRRTPPLMRTRTFWMFARSQTLVCLLEWLTR
jgi:hypothetical protein